jgi:hypothetical protein
MNMNFISEAQTKYLYQLLNQLQKGRLFMPKFQRGLVWNDEQRLDLLRSIKAGIPIGSFLVWETNRYHLATFEKMAGISVPNLPDIPGLCPYLLDGCQRLLTLFGALNRPTNIPLENEANIVDDVDWRIFYDYEQEDFLLQLRKKPKPTWIPVNILLDSVALLKFLRTLKNEEMRQQADQLSNIFFSYTISLVALETNDLEKATTAFQRLNSGCTPKSDLEIAAAFSWTEQFDLTAKIAEAQVKLAEVVWDTLSDKFILSACRARLEWKFYDTYADETSQLLKENPNIIDDVVTNFIQVAKFLSECGIYTPQMLPYGYQSVLLAEAIRANPFPNDAVSQLLKNWLWRTAYTDAFIGINEANLEGMLDDILALLAGEQQNALDKEIIAPFPTEFHFNSSRGKLLALRLAELKPQDENGKPLAAGQLLGLYGNRAMLRLIGGYLSTPENCFIVAPQDFTKFRNYLIHSTTWRDDFLHRHAISDKAAQALQQGDYETFLAKRRNTLIELEKSFIQPLGLDYE